LGIANALGIEMVEQPEWFSLIEAIDVQAKAPQSPVRLQRNFSTGDRVGLNDPRQRTRAQIVGQQQ
jgi:hypothetical protein